MHENDKGIVTEIADLAAKAVQAEDRIVEVGDEAYSTTQLHRLPPVYYDKEPEPAALTLHTLTGLAAYLKENRDELALDSLLVHVAEPDLVHLRSKLTGDALQRFRYIEVQAHNRFAAVPTFAFGKFIPAEDFNIAVQSLFRDEGDRPTVLRLVGRIRDVNEAEIADDGVTQLVTTKTGVHLVNDTPEPAPSRVRLTPFRTFAEVDQPESPFVLRVKKDDGGAIKAALFEADGGAWKNTAIESVAAWLAAELPQAVAVIA